MVGVLIGRVSGDERVGKKEAVFRIKLQCSLSGWVC